MMNLKKMNKRVRIFSLFIAFIMCISSVQPVHAVNGADTEPTYYINNTF